MSDYGKLWAEVSEVREAIKALVPEADTSTWATANEASLVSVRDLRSQAERVERLMRRWASLEAEMARCDGGVHHG